MKLIKMYCRLEAEERDTKRDRSRSPSCLTEVFLSRNMEEHRAGDRSFWQRFIFCLGAPASPPVHGPSRKHRASTAVYVSLHCLLHMEPTQNQT